ncbi:hypothetical protein FJZ48_02610, partial [Candidatus Uhrbacteria bacterium]|nr:hypothetical protein [Candidatus Uhrbacteria bacterium]
MSHHRSRFARFFTLFLFFVVTGVFVFGEPAAALFENNPAGGAGIGMPMMMTGSLVEMANNGYKNIVSQITRAGVVAFFNALQNFAGTLAYDAANYIASGGKGQDAVYYKKGFGNYLKDVASDAAGEFIGGLSDSDFFRKAGFDLCKPRDPRLMINLQVNLGNFFPGQQGQFSRPKPRCDYQEIVKNYSALYQTMSNEDAYKNASISLSTEQSDIGTMAQIFTTYQQQITSKIDGASKTRTEGQGYKDIQGYVSGYTKTPSQVVKETTNEQVIRKPGQTELAQTGAILTNAFKEGPIQLAVYTASVFLNTLTSKFMKRIFEKGLGPITFTAVNVNGVDTVVTAGKTDARSANIDLRTPNLQKVATFEVMAELIACPQPPTPRGLWNCTIDQPFAQAIQTQGDQGGFTIGEALAKDLLHKTWKLIPSDAAHVKDNQSLDCFLQNYCASNLQKLRLNRILPVGFEFAANSEANKERCASAQGCVTLQEVVDGFTDCNDKGELDREHPWCHLIDSNWVITSVPQQCLTSGYSETLLSNSIDQRKEECQDVQSCLKRNNKGQCVGGYGYCLADKTVYRFTADECPVQYASCRVYQNRAGEQVSYLRNTLDYAQCTADNVGCLWYATERNATSTEWIGTTSTGPRVYFDKTLVPCDAANEGCTKLHQMNVGQSALNLLLNSSFEKFAPNSTTLLADWKTDIELTVPKVQAGTPALDG